MIDTGGSAFLPVESWRFEDYGDGTVTDNSTNLMRERKAKAVGSGPDSANPHDVNNVYTWAACATASDGTASPCCPLTGWCIDFQDGAPYNNTKTDSCFVRAVRSES